VAEHLIQHVTFWHLEYWFLLLVPHLHVHYLNDFIFILEESFHFLNLVNLFCNALRKIVKSFEQDFFVFSESLDIGIKSFDVSV